MYWSIWSQSTGLRQYLATLSLPRPHRRDWYRDIVRGPTLPCAGLGRVSQPQQCSYSTIRWSCLGAKSSSHFGYVNPKHNARSSTCSWFSRGRGWRTDSGAACLRAVLRRSSERSGIAMVGHAATSFRVARSSGMYVTHGACVRQWRAEQSFSVACGALGLLGRHVWRSACTSPRPTELSPDIPPASRRNSAYVGNSPVKRGFSGRLRYRWSSDLWIRDAHLEEGRHSPGFCVRAVDSDDQGLGSDAGISRLGLEEDDEASESEWQGRIERPVPIEGDSNDGVSAVNDGPWGSAEYAELRELTQQLREEKCTIKLKQRLHTGEEAREVETEFLLLWIVVHQEEEWGAFRAYESLQPMTQELAKSSETPMVPFMQGLAGRFNFSLSDTQDGPWRCFRILISGSIDLTSPDGGQTLFPNCVLWRWMAPEGYRCRHNVRHAHDLVAFLSEPTTLRLQAHLENLQRIGQERGYKQAWVYHRLRSCWGQGVARQLCRDKRV